MSLWLADTPASVLAFVTTVHAAIAILRGSRSAGAPRLPLLLLPSIAFTLAPWFLSTPAGLLATLAAHLAWFVACEKLAPAAMAGGKSGRGDGTAPVSPGRFPVADASRSLHAKAFVPVTILAVHDESDTIRTFRMARPDHFSFVAGQFLTVRVHIDGQPHVRCYSVSSAPGALGYLEISVRRQGTVSNALHASCGPGSVLLVKPPAGKFLYPEGDPRPLVLLAGGVGITPLISMLRHAVASDPLRPVTLLFSVRTERDIAFRDELGVIARRHPQVRVVITLSHAEPDSRFRLGHIDETLIRQTVPSPADSIFCICGPVPMIDAMRGMLLALGVPREQVRSEEFQPTAAIGARAAAVACTAGAAPTKLVCTVSNRVVDVAPGATLLDAADAAGVHIPSLCRAGVCGTCKSRLVSGAVRCSSETLDEDDRAEGYTLPCVAWPTGDCAIEA